MCLLFCFVLFWILCCVVCEKIKIKIVDNKKKKLFFICENVIQNLSKHKTVKKIIFSFLEAHKSG